MDPNRARKQLGMTMENKKSMNVNDLPQALIEDVLLRLPLRSLLVSRCVCRTWLHLISDPNFAKSHFEIATAPTLTRRCCIFIHGPNALSFDLDSLFHDGYVARKFSLPCEKHSKVYVLESCRGFILLDQYPHLIIWNPVTGARKQILYSHVVSNVERLYLLWNVLLCGFGYDPSKDDYMLVLAWRDKNKQDHFDFFSVRNNSWKSFGVALPNSLLDNVWRCGLFLNGAIHWLGHPPRLDEPILVFDMMERSFSEISLPEPVVGHWCRLVELGGCLAFYFWSNEEGILRIWVMKEYKVQSSWTSYAISDIDFLPIGLSSDGHIIGFDDDDIKGGFSKYSFRGEWLEHCSYNRFPYYRYTVYTESLLPLPSDS